MMDAMNLEPTLVQMALVHRRQRGGGCLCRTVTFVTCRLFTIGFPVLSKPRGVSDITCHKKGDDCGKGDKYLRIVAYPEILIMQLFAIKIGLQIPNKRSLSPKFYSKPKLKSCNSDYSNITVSAPRVPTALRRPDRHIDVRVPAVPHVDLLRGAAAAEGMAAAIHLRAFPSRCG